MNMTGSSEIGSLQYLCLLGIRGYSSASPAGLPASVSEAKPGIPDADTVELSSESGYAVLVSPSHAVVPSKNPGLVKRIVEIDVAEASGAPYSASSGDVSSILGKYRAISSPADPAPRVDMFI